MEFEKKYLNYLREGLTQAQMAKRLNISVRTLQRTIKNLDAAQDAAVEPECKNYVKKAQVILMLKHRDKKISELETKVLDLQSVVKGILELISPEP